ncbi:MAG TPA: hypothetical protein VG164_05705 [Trebonia sp.]|jgi:hypothetical protein|nr:hypothetical protein [Trebonia sp.]
MDGPVRIESVARMGMAEVEACLRDDLNPQMPVGVLHVALERLWHLQAKER